MKRQSVATGVNVLPCATPTTLWLFVTAMACIFFMSYWPYGSVTSQVVQQAGRHAGPLVESGAGVQNQQKTTSADPAKQPAEQQQQKNIQQQQQQGSSGQLQQPGGKVDLELFVMSLCPDASYCEHAFGKLLDRLHPIVHVTSRYIQSKSGDSVTCPHGHDECTGNMLQLCVGQHVPREHNYDWFMKFLLCTWDSGVGPFNKSVVKTCLSQVGASEDVQKAAGACADGGEGQDLMRGAAGVASDRGIKRSCTVVIEGTKRCIRDGGRWYDCPGGSSDEEFTRSLCDAYKKKTGKDADVCAGADGSSGSSGNVPTAQRL